MGSLSMAQKWREIGVGGWALLGFAGVAYAVPRANFSLFITIYTFLFGLYFYWCYQSKNNFQEQNFKYYFIAAILLRCVFLFSTPALSDDFWRYFWDGRLVCLGVNPYQFLPSELVQTPLYAQANLEQLYAHLNSPNYYSVYPPLQQAIFALSNYFFMDNVFAALCILHGIAILIDIGVIAILYKILQIFQKPRWVAFFYAFNPLIIIELHGNLHTELTMLFFLTLALYGLLKNKYHLSAFGFAMAVASKILPLILMPLILRRLWFWKGIKYCIIVGIVNLAILALFFDIELLKKMQAGMRLYFAHFEFNASIYSLVRYGIINEYWWIWQYHHEYFLDERWVEDSLRYDWYALWRNILPFISLCFILLLSFEQGIQDKVRFFLRRMLFVYTVYLFFAMTIHPWYISPLILLAVLTPYHYPLVWSYLIGWTYIAYSGNGFMENSWVIGIEYSLVLVALAWEWRTK